MQSRRSSISPGSGAISRARASRPAGPGGRLRLLLHAPADISLDELPQLWNVLRGQMSLVRPYKIAPDDRHHYGTRWLSVVTLKPGITGMAQVHGRGELTIEERSILDAEYVRAYSLWRDFAVLAASIPAAIRGRGAF